MAQVDPCGGGGGGGDDDPETQMEYAPESFWLSKDAEMDWLDRNAFMDRKDSGKAAAAAAANSNPSLGSNRYYSGSSKSKPSIIGLPKATKPNYSNRRHCKPPSIRLFPKRSESKSGAGMSEPSSPKVSCMGRVRSKKERSRRGGKKNHHRNNKVTETGGGGVVLVRNKSIHKSKGFWNNFRSIFRPNHNHNNNNNNNTVVEDDNNNNNNNNKACDSMKKRGFNFNNKGSSSSSPAEAEAPGLGGVKRFASGRRSDAWAADVEVEGANSNSNSEPGPLWRRRDHIAVDVELIGKEVQRDWHSLGPASV